MKGFDVPREQLEAGWEAEEDRLNELARHKPECGVLNNSLSFPCTCGAHKRSAEGKSAEHAPPFDKCAGRADHESAGWQSK